MLKLLENEPPNPDVLWLRANATLDDDERISLLQELTDGYSDYAHLAREMLERETESQQQLDEPPDHHFWKKPTPKKIWAQKYWLLGLVFLVFMGISLLKTEKENREEILGIEAEVHATQTQDAYSTGKMLIEYAAGTLSIVDVEDSTNRQVTFGRIENEQYILAEPASGARFLAVQVNFQCRQPLCEQPPHAELFLKLQGNDIVGYPSSSRPFLVDQPPDTIRRIAQGEYETVWFIFEVPRSTSPVSLRVTVEDREEPLFISWPVR